LWKNVSGNLAFPANGFRFRNKGANPYAIDGYKSLAFELVKQLGSEPDQVVFAIAGGDSLVGTWKGLSIFIT